MQATQTKLVQFLQGTKQFRIPIYQRPYSWAGKQAKRLFEDVLRIADDAAVPTHFTGAVVTIAGGVQTSAGLSRYDVIDGQQRLTTLSLLLIAMRDRARSLGEAAGRVHPAQIDEQYLVNKFEHGDDRWKLLPTLGDRAEYVGLVGGLPGKGAASPLQHVAEFFAGRLADADAAGLERLQRGLNKLVVVEVTLDPQHDRPQQIFESLNSTGLALTEADKIRNYVLMDLPHERQNEVYEKHWRPMENLFGPDGYASRFDDYVRHFLTVRTGDIPNKRAVYEQFQRYVEKARQRDADPAAAVRRVVADLHALAGHFHRIALGGEPDAALRRRFADLIELRVDTALPLLLAAYERYAHGEYGREDVGRLVDLIESFVVRRFVCGMPANAINWVFADLAKRVYDADDEVAALERRMAGYRASRRFPADEEFRQELAAAKLYHPPARARFMLRRLENFGHANEPVDAAGLTVEHVMPQNAPKVPAWREELGDDWRRVHETYLHTLGNLTLTGYNSKLSDRPFAEKKAMVEGYADSALWLNKVPAQAARWDESAIRRRAELLADRAVKLWPAPAAPAAEGADEKAKADYLLEEADYLAGGATPPAVRPRRTPVAGAARRDHEGADALRQLPARRPNLRQRRAAGERPAAHAENPGRRAVRSEGPLHERRRRRPPGHRQRAVEDRRRIRLRLRAGGGAAGPRAGRESGVSRPPRGRASCRLSRPGRWRPPRSWPGGLPRTSTRATRP